MEAKSAGTKSSLFQCVEGFIAAVSDCLLPLNLTTFSSPQKKPWGALVCGQLAISKAEEPKVF